MIKIIPAILSHNVEDLNKKLQACQDHFKEAQIDLMDGVFVPNKTITAHDLRQVTTPLKLEAHLMVQDPSTWIQDLMGAHFTKIIVHQEIGLGLMTAIKTIKSLGMKSGIAINPDSEMEASRDFWDEVDCIQVMGVNPGHYGATFQTTSVEKIRFLREAGFKGEIEVDGGVTPETAPTLMRAGAQILVVGHYFFGSEEEPTLDKIGEKFETLRTALGTTS